MSQWNIAEKCIKLAETESTNLYLKNMLLEQSLDDFSVVIADYQTKGRGQMGNGWTSDRGENLLFSILISPHFVKPTSQFIISQVISVAIAKVLARYTDGIKIKWPNDIYYKNNKIAGILIENTLMGNTIEKSIIGVGLNLNQNIFPEFLVNPISLSKITGSKYLLDDMLNQIMDEFCKQFSSIESGKNQQVVDEYMSMMYRFEPDSYYQFEDDQGGFCARIVEVKPSGHIVMQQADTHELRTYAFKEVRYILSNE